MELEVLLHLLIHSSVRRLGRIRSGNRVLEVNSRVLWNKPSETAYTNRSIRAQSLKSPEGTRKHKKTISLRFVRVGIRYNPYVLYVSVSGKSVPNHLLRHRLGKVKDKQFAELCILCAVVNEIIKYLRSRFESRCWRKGQRNRTF